MHVLAVNFEREKKIFIRGIRCNAELGEIAEEALACVAHLMQEGVFCFFEEFL
jgi:hypothetical protein